MWKFWCFMFLLFFFPRFLSSGLCLMAPSSLGRCCQAWCGPPVSMPAELSSPGWLSTRACILYSSCFLLHLLFTIPYRHGSSEVCNNSTIDYSVLFWCELSSFEDIGRRDFRLLSSIMGLNGALDVVLTAPKYKFEKLNSNVSSQKSWLCNTK